MLKRCGKNKGIIKENKLILFMSKRSLELNLFFVIYYAIYHGKGTWLIDSGYANHMVNDLSFFKELELPYNSKVRIGNKEILETKRKDVTLLKMLRC